MISHRPTFGDMLANVPAPRFDRTAPARIVRPLDNSRVYPMERASRAGGYIGLALFLAALAFTVWFVGRIGGAW
jgi:hypothetical protein